MILLMRCHFSVSSNKNHEKACNVHTNTMDNNYNKTRTRHFHVCFPNYIFSVRKQLEEYVCVVVCQNKSENWKKNYWLSTNKQTKKIVSFVWWKKSTFNIYGTMDVFLHRIDWLRIDIDFIRLFRFHDSGCIQRVIQNHKHK